MRGTKPTLLLVVSVVALMVTVADGQAPQGGRAGGRGVPPGGGPGAGGRGPAMTTPKAAIPNVKPVRSCESLASVVLPNTTIESAAIDPATSDVCRIVAVTTHPPAGDSAGTLPSRSRLPGHRTARCRDWRTSTCRRPGPARRARSRVPETPDRPEQPPRLPERSRSGRGECPLGA